MASADSFMKKFAKNAIDFVDDIGNFTYKNSDGNLTKLRSNKAINPIGKFIMGEANTGIRGTLTEMSKGKSFGNALKSAYTDSKGNLNKKAIAGTYVGGAIAGRIATGGGIYRDSTGNTNVPVLPFV